MHHSKFKTVLDLSSKKLLPFSYLQFYNYDLITIYCEKQKTPNLLYFSVKSYTWIVSHLARNFVDLYDPLSAGEANASLRYENLFNEVTHWQNTRRNVGGVGLSNVSHIGQTDHLVKCQIVLGVGPGPYDFM